MRRSTAIPLFALVSLLIGGAADYAARAQGGGLRILSREGSRTLTTTTVNNQEYTPLDEVASTFGLAVKEDRLAGGVTVSAGPRTVIITPDQPVVSVAGRLVSLAAPPVRQGTRWLVPLEFLQRAVGPLVETRVELRRASRLVVVGDLRVPRVTVRVEPAPVGVTAVFEATPATPARVSIDGGRLLVQFEADAIDLQAPPTMAEKDFLQAVQPGEAAATVRVVPGPRFALHRATSSSGDAGASRLAVDLLPAGAEPPATPAPAVPAAPTSPAPVVEDPLPMPSPAPGIRTIVIDPGHGGEETGARGPGGALEKDITLQVARRLRTMIESRLGLRVFLTRDDDRTLSLDGRTAYANSQRADVFISIHANAALRPGLKGAEVYFLSMDPPDLSRGGASGQRNTLPTLGGGTRAIELVLWETAQTQHLDESGRLANLIEQALRSRVEMSPRPIQQAPFRVLVGATMPAVLVEIGYLSNPEQEQALSSGNYQDQVTQALFNGLVQFRASLERSAPRPPQ